MQAFLRSLGSTTTTMNPSKGGRDRHNGNTRIIFSPPPPSHFAAFLGFYVPNQLIPVSLITPNMTLLAKSKMAAINTNYSAFTRLQCWIQTHGRLRLIKTHGIWNEETFTPQALTQPNKMRLMILATIHHDLKYLSEYLLQDDGFLVAR